ncbi:MAG: hypothetical protein RL693_764, partial [Verrucomicrobiota bacterium]
MMFDKLNSKLAGSLLTRLAAGCFDFVTAAVA